VFEVVDGCSIVVVIESCSGRDGGRVEGEEEEVLNQRRYSLLNLRHRSGPIITTNDVIHPHPIIHSDLGSRLNQPEFVGTNKTR
jgi:hypothetical protein